MVATALSLSLTACDEDSAGKSADADASKSAQAKAGEAVDKGGPKGAFEKYQAKSMASEAKVSLAGIMSGVRSAHTEERMDPAGLGVVTGQLPPAAPMTPAAGTCCKQPDGTCPPDMGNWDHEGWKAVMFRPRDPHRYSYELVVEADAVIVRAVGDLDCDGELSTYEAKAKVVDGELQVAPDLEETSPLE